MPTEHRANITWSQALAERGLPTTSEVIESAWIDPDAPGEHDGWRLVCGFEAPPSEQGNPSAATVRFASDDAPDDRLSAGITLRLREPGTGHYASVAILD